MLRKLLIRLFDKKKMMSKFSLFILLLALCFSCVEKSRKRTEPLSQVSVFPVLEDTSLSVRALELGEEYLYYGSSDHLGKYALDNQLKVNLDNFSIDRSKDYFKYVLTDADTPLHFRAIAQVNGDLIAVSIANPAKVYKLSRKAKNPQLVYEERHESVFYDAMKFWNAKEGIAIGDPTDGCMSMIITRDGGESWTKMPCGNLPPTKNGEAAFAASDTNIAIVGDNTWVATGGETSRVLYSPDKGVTWEVYNTPNLQGKATTGLYSLDFYNDKIGFGIGGDYTRPNDSTANKIATTDGGKTWTLMANNQSPGYRSCVQYIPNSNGQELVAVGFKGIDYSSDSGQSWTQLSDEGFYTIRFLNDSIAFAGGRGRISKLLFR